MGTRSSTQLTGGGDARRWDRAAARGRAARGLSLGAYLGGVVALVALLAVAAVFMVRARTYEDARTAALETQEFAAKQASNDVSASLTALRGAVVATAATPGLAKVFVDASGCGLNFAGTGGFKVGRLEVLRADGSVVCSSRPIGANYRDAAWLRAKPSAALLMAPAPDPVSGAWTVVAAAPIKGSEGFIVGSFDIAELGSGLAARFAGPHRPEFMVLSADGKTILSRSIAPSAWVAHPLPKSDLAAAGGGARTDVDGTERLYGSSVVDGFGWRVLAGEDSRTALAVATQRFHRDLASLAIGLALVLAAALFVRRRITRPIGVLSRTVRSVAREHLDPQVGPSAEVTIPSAVSPSGRADLRAVSGATEVVALARDFDNLVTVVERELAARHATEDQLRGSLVQLEATDAQRRRLLNSLVTAQEEERRRIASDVHDDSIQVMAAVGMRVGMLRAQHAGDAALDTQLQRLEETCEQSIYRLRHLLFQLRPPSLDSSGLVAALDEYLQQWTEEAAISYQLDDRLSHEPPPDTRSVIFRIAQEALTNVRKHARASEVRIVLEDRPPGVLLRITDNGVGFTELNRSPSGVDHFGLVSMRERADIAGGWWRIESDGSDGTTVEAWIPVSSDAAAA
jgi:signal transduction histidine kinase